MNKILEIKFGSHLYGTDTPNSDLDIKGIYLPTAREICLNGYKRTITTTRPKRTFERNNKDDVDIEVFSLDRYVELLVDGQAVALDMLFAPEASYTQKDNTGIMEGIFLQRDKFISKSMTGAFFGYAKQQASKYGQKGFRVHALREALNYLNSLPEHSRLQEHDCSSWITQVGNEHIKIAYCKGPKGEEVPHLEVCDKKYQLNQPIKAIKVGMQKRFDEYGHRALLAEKNEGVDWKALSHAVRVNTEAKELLETGFITFPCPNRELLLKIKLGEMPYKEVSEIIEQGLQSLKEAELRSTLREQPDMSFVNDFLFDVYSSIVRA